MVLLCKPYHSPTYLLLFFEDFIEFCVKIAETNIQLLAVRLLFVLSYNRRKLEELYFQRFYVKHQSQFSEDNFFFLFRIFCEVGSVYICEKFQKKLYSVWVHFMTFYVVTLQIHHFFTRTIVERH